MPSLLLWPPISAVGVAEGTRTATTSRAEPQLTDPHVIPFENAAGAGTDLLGGKGASLAALAGAGLRVPPGFVVSADAYRRTVVDGIGDELGAALSALPDGGGTAPDELDAATARVRELVAAVELGPDLADAVRRAYGALGGDGAGGDDTAVAVRSSSAAEDSAEHSFAGEHDTHLWVRGADEVLARVRDCWASLFTARATGYRRRAGLDGAGDAMAVVVQEMVPARAAGVLMTLNPENGDRSKVAVESVWGLGELLVSGAATPDGFLLDKVTAEVVRRTVVEKPTEMVEAGYGGGTAVVDVPAGRRTTASLTDAELAELLRLGRLVERHFGRPQDAEFVVGHGEAPDNVFLVQSRPETVWSRRSPAKASTGANVMESILSNLVPRRSTS